MKVRGHAAGSVTTACRTCSRVPREHATATGERLAGRPRSDPLTAPDEFLQRKRRRPRLGLGNCGMPEILPGHGQHQAGAGQVGRADDAAAVRGELDPVPGHNRDDFRVRRVSRIIPAERTGIVTPSVASRCASSAAAIGDRHTFAVHSTTMPTSPGNPAAHGLPEKAGCHLCRSSRYYR